MREILVAVCGDHWLNIEQLRRELMTIQPHDDVKLVVESEGPSLSALGVTDVILDWCQANQRDPGTIQVSRWSNSVESVPFVRDGEFEHSHFMHLCRDYWPEEPAGGPGTFAFAFFMGRRTVPRSKMMFDLHQHFANHTLFSMMRGSQPEATVGRNLETVDEWVPRDQLSKFLDWWHHHDDVGDLVSLDNHAVQDQYNPRMNTNRDILRHYDDFAIEIVCETYARGNSYFPTEKTVRPLTAGKPILVYAPRHFLRRLRDQGFQTWHDLWDESYDELEGPRRWEGMLEVMHSIHKHDMQNLWHLSRDIAQHNRRRLAHIAGITLPHDQARIQ